MKNWLKLCLTLVLVFTLSTGASLSALAAQIVLPASLKTIEEEAFEGSDSIDEVVLPEGVTAIAGRAFADSSIRSIVLPRSLKTIADDAFEGSDNVRAKVYLDSDALKWCAANKIPYTIIDAAVSSANGASISAAKTTAAMGESVKFTLTADPGTEIIEGGRTRVSVTYLNAAGAVVGAETKNWRLGDSNYRLECSDAVSALLTVISGGDYAPGKNASVTVQLTGGDTHVFYKFGFVGTAYPGGKLRVYVSAVNAQYMTGSKTVTFTDVNGRINENLGTLSAETPSITADVEIPTVCVDANGEWIEYEISLKVGDTEYRTYSFTTAPCEDYTAVPVGEESGMEYVVIPSEMPYTYAIEDTSIATIDETGWITGVSEGVTTATLTTKSGYVWEFEVEVYTPEVSEIGDPVLYVTPAAETITEGSSGAIFHIRSTVEGALAIDESVRYILRFYDADGELINSVRDSIYCSGPSMESVSAQWNWFADEGGDDYRYIELDLKNCGYEIFGSSTARVRVIRQSELGKLIFSADYAGECMPGDTAQSVVTCLTPELLKGVTKDNPVLVYPVSNNTTGYDIFTDSEPAKFWEGHATDVVTIILSDTLVANAGYSIRLFCGSEEVDTFSVYTPDYASAMYNELFLIEGESCELPLNIDESDVRYVRYDIVGDTGVIEVKDGVVTALSAGETEVSAEYMDGYGRWGSRWFYVRVAKPASENLPTLTVTVGANSVQYGRNIPVTLKLSECIYDEIGAPEEIEIDLAAYFLDARNENMLSNSDWVNFPADELVRGVNLSWNPWYAGDNSLTDIENVLIRAVNYSDIAKYKIIFTPTLIPVTGIPAADELVYGANVYNMSGVQQGDALEILVWRTQGSIGRNVDIAICDANGRDYAVDIFEDDTFSRYVWIEDIDLPVGDHTLFLYVNGKRVENVEIPIRILEARLNINGLDGRQRKGNTAILSYDYRAEDYDCPVTFSSSDESIATVSGNIVNFVGSGYVTITATCAHGQTASERVAVYDPSSNVKPNLYLLPYDEDYEAEWMDYVNCIIGTTTDLIQIGEDYISTPCGIEFLDADGKVVCEDEFYIYHSLSDTEENDGWDEYDVWVEAAKGGATAVRVTLIGDYYCTVDPQRNTVTYPLGSIEDYPYPLVIYNCPRTVEEGDDLIVTFECLNPSKLGSGKTVSLTDYVTEEVLASGTLTKTQPIVTLTHELGGASGDNSESGYNEYQFNVNYPYKSGYDSVWIGVTVSKVYGFGPDCRVRVGSTTSMRADCNGGEPELTFTTSDASIAAIDSDYGYGVRIRGVSSGIATITATTAKGETFSSRVVVYDSANTVVPDVGFSSEQTAEMVRWQNSIRLNVETTSSIESFGYISVGFKTDYLNADGEVVDTASVYSSPINDFTSVQDAVSYRADPAVMGIAYGKGARYVRFTLLDTYCNPIPGQDSVILPIEDIAAYNKPIIYIDAPKYGAADTPFSVNIACVNPGALNGQQQYLLKSDCADPIPVTLSTDQPGATVSYTLPEMVFELYGDYYMASRSRPVGYTYDHRMSLRDQFDSQIAMAETTLIRGDVYNISKMHVGGSLQMGWELPDCDDLTLSLASSNPDVATIDETGLITAVAPGATEIVLTYGPLVIRTFMRVYTNNPEGVPEIYVYNSTPEQELSPDYSYYLGVKVTDGVESLKSYLYVYVDAEYLNDAGEVVYTCKGSGSSYFSDGLEDTFYFSSSDVTNAVMRGATKVRVCVSDGQYTVSEDTQPFIIPIADPSEWTGTHFGYEYADVLVAGQEARYVVKLLSVGDEYAGKDCIITFNMEVGSTVLVKDKQYVLNAENPSCELKVMVPEGIGGLSCDCTIRFEGSEYDYPSEDMYADVLNFYGEQSDEVIPVGGTFTADYSYSPSNLPVSYESSNPAVASVDENGQVTGVSVGTAVITAKIGPVSRTFSVRVYDESAVQAAKLSLSAPEGEKWSWDGTGRLIITSDQLPEDMGYVDYAYIISRYYDAEDTLVESDNGEYDFDFIDSSAIVIDIKNDVNIKDMINGGVVSVEHELSSISGGNVSINRVASEVTLPMESLADFDDAVISVATPSIDTMVSGKQYTLNVTAANYAYNKPVTLHAQVNDNDHTDLGSVTFVPAQNPNAELVLSVPEGIASGTRYIRILRVNEDGTETELSEFYVNLISLPPVTEATSIAQLQSEHPYVNNCNAAWSYTVEGAVSLSVTLDAQSETERGWDYVKLTTVAGFEEGQYTHNVSGSIGGKTYDVEGDTVVIHLTTDGSSTRWGFAVAQIVATMADGSTVTITE